MLPTDVVSVGISLITRVKWEKSQFFCSSSTECKFSSNFSSILLTADEVEGLETFAPALSGF